MRVRGATSTLRSEPDVWTSIQSETGKDAIDGVRRFFTRRLGHDPARIDDIDVTAALMEWAKRMRGFDVSKYPAQALEFIVHVVDAALWLGWTYPSSKRRPKPPFL